MAVGVRARGGKLTLKGLLPGAAAGTDFLAGSFGNRAPTVCRGSEPGKCRRSTTKGVSAIHFTHEFRACGSAGRRFRLREAH